MPKMPIILDVDVESDWKFDSTLQIFTDNGSGTLETDPIFSRPLKSFAETRPPTPWGRQTWGRGAWGGGFFRSMKRRAWGRPRWGIGEWGRSPRYVRILVYVDQGVGNYKFAARAIDGSGNAQSGADVEVIQPVSGEAPFPLAAFDFSSYDSGNDQLLFSVRG